MPDKTLDDQLCQECLEAQSKSGIDIQRLLKRLAQIKQEFYPGSSELSAKEISYLCLNLCRYSKGEIAYYFYKHKIPNASELKNCLEIKKWRQNLNAEMAGRVHKYIKTLMGAIDLNERMPPWKDVILFLKEQGYEVPTSTTNPSPGEQDGDRPIGEIALRVLVEGEGVTIEELALLLEQNGIANVKISEIVDRSN